ncbi:MAG: hypothetical protein WAV04_01315 [Candidatus Microsaccharimonas sp.]
MSTTTPRKIEITRGPNDDELADAWKYAFDPSHPDFTVEFAGHWADDHMKVSLPIRAQITGLLYESGMRGMVMVQANIQIDHANTGRSWTGWTAIGFYNVQTRVGYFLPGYFAWTERTD